MNEPLRILLLGHPQVFAGDQPVEVSRREVRALLYYLACQRAPVSRSQLIGLLWPDTTEERARKRLRETLARLRHALPEHVHLQSFDDQLMLPVDGVQSDVREFQTVVDETARPLAQLPGTMPLPAALYQSMARGVELWRSPVFLAEARLPDVPNWERWQRETDGQLGSAYQRLLERLADHDVATGNFHQAMVWLEKALELDSLNDGLHLHLAGLYERIGWFGQGLAYLQQVRARYQEEGMAFPAALGELERRLHEELTLPREAHAAPWPGQWTAQLPFFGRKAELARLQSACRRGGVAVVLGEPGSGKTRLMQELVPALQPAPRLLVALARPLETSLPFQPLIDMLRSQVTADEWRELPRTWLATLALLLPELSILFSDLDDTQAPPSLTQSTLFEAFSQALRLLNRSQRLLVFLDDVQWCDETSLHALNYLIEHNFFGERAALVLACREDDQPLALNVVLRHLARRAPPEVIHLLPLEREDVAGMARFVLGVELSAPVVERFGRDTGGNPLFLLESLRALLEYPPELRRDFDLAHLPISGSMRALIHQRLDQLSPDARQTLTIAAVIGSQVDLEVLEPASGLSSERLAQALDELEQRRLLHPLSGEDGEHGGAYRFIHDRIREIIHLELSPARRRIYHLRVANALRNKYSLDDAPHAAVLAQHFESAGEWPEAFAAWRRAAAYARKLLSLGEAESAARSAERLLEQLGAAISDEEIYAFYDGWIDFAFNTGNLEGLQYAAERLLQHGQRRQNARNIARGYLGLTGVDDLRDRAEAGLLTLERAWLFFQQAADPVLWLWFYYRRGGFLILQNRYVEAIQVLEQAAAARLEDPRDPAQLEAICGARYRLGQAYLQNGWPARSLREGERLVEDGRALLNHRASLNGLMTVAVAEYFMGHYPTSGEYARTALHMAEPMKNPRMIGTALINLSKTELTLGHLDGAFEQAQQALQVGAPTPPTRIAAQAYRVLGDVMGALNDYEQAESFYRQGVAAADPNYSLIDNQFRLGWLLVSKGQVDEGEAIVDLVIDFCLVNELTLHLVSAQVAKTYALLARGRLEEANALGRQVSALAIERDLMPVHAMAFTALAATALQAGRADEAAQKGWVVIRAGRELGNPLLELRAIGLVLVALGPSDPAAGELRQRLMQLIADLGQNCRSQALRPSYERFTKKLTELQIR